MGLKKWVWSSSSGSATVCPTVQASSGDLARTQDCLFSYFTVIPIEDVSFSPSQRSQLSWQLSRPCAEPCGISWAVHFNSVYGVVL